MMIGFREFIEEGWSRPYHARYKARPWDSTMAGDNDHWSNKKSIDGHEVEVTMKPIGVVGGKKRTGHQVDYSVNRNFSNKPDPAYPGRRFPSPKTSQEILRHVHSKIIQFRKRRKPAFMTFSTGDPVKDKLHGHLVKHLAKKHDGKPSHAPKIDGIRTIQFNDKK